MIKKQVQYMSSLDALIAVAKRLSVYEQEQNLESEEFFDQYTKEILSDDLVFVEWANDYRHYQVLHQEIRQKLSYAA